MGVAIDVKMENKKVKALLSSLQARTKDLSPVMKVIAQIVQTSVIKNFAVGGRPSWKPSLRVKCEGGKTLILTGRLMNSIKADVYPERLELRTNLPYARIHQFGAFIRAKGHRLLKFKVCNRWFTKEYVLIPARPYLMVHKEDWREIKKALSGYLRGGLNG